MKNGTMNGYICCQLLLIHWKIVTCVSDERDVLFAFAGDYRSVYKPHKIGGGIGRVKNQLNESMVFIFVGNNVGGVKRDRSGIELGKAVMEYLKPDAVILAKAEFDVPVADLEWYIANTPNVVVSANLECRKNMAQEKVIFHNSVKIVVIGYTDDPYLVTLADVFQFRRIIQSLNERAHEIELSSTKTGLIVAAGCTGIELATEIAQQTSFIDIVFSSCSRSLMWHDDNPPKGMYKHGPYPLYTRNRDGKGVLVAHSFGTTQFLGLLNVRVDKRGEINNFTGQMLHLTNTLPNDPEGDKLASGGLDPIDIPTGTLGESRVFLDGSCYKTECNLGNLITDSFIDVISDEYEGEYWTDVPIALVCATSIRSSINTSIHNGIILADDLSNVMEDELALLRIKVKGKDLMAALEHGVDLNQREFDKKFMQMSGVRIIYDTRRKLGNRIVDIRVRCAACDIPVYEPLNLEEVYNVTVTSDLLELEYGLISDTSAPNSIGGTNWDAVERYVKKKKVICPGNTDRITQLPLITASNLMIIDKVVIIINCIAILYNIFHLL